MPLAIDASFFVTCDDIPVSNVIEFTYFKHLSHPITQLNRAFEKFFTDRLISNTN